MIILKSLLITISLSLMFAFGLRNLVGFWEVFTLTAALQFVASFIYSSIKLSREQSIIDLYQEEIDSILDMSTVSVECPCGKNTFDDNIFTAVDNIFECDVCGSKFKAAVSITPTLLTEPVLDTGITIDKLPTTKEEL